jgi:poly-beta-1,6-N-acetyl-D-glucosamine biosynthesis protein PgaD
MDEPGSGDLTMDSMPIIERPNVLPPLRRHTEWSITAAGWAVWVGLCRPLSIALLWIFGARQFYEHMIRLGGLQAIVHFFSLYSYVILAIGVVLMGWNRYNHWRYGGQDRRRQTSPVGPGELEQAFRLPAGAIQLVHSWSECWITFDAQGGMALEPRGAAPQAGQAPPLRGCSVPTVGPSAQ